jgi:branched-chain amino acid transport system ATP-binding protein
MTLFEAAHVHQRFGQHVVLEDISLAFEEGKVSGIMGPNGAGKTTCFNVLTGRYKPDRGQIRFAGRRIDGLSPQRIARAGLARSFQTINLFDEFSVIENIMLALPAVRARRHRVFYSAVADSTVREKALEIMASVGLEGHEAEISRNLSYGDRRALEIGVALAAEPRILFLDEPTSGLGTDGTARLARLVGQLRLRYTIVIIEHDMRFLFDLSDRISVIQWGQVIAEGTPDELRRNKWVQRSDLGRGG